MCPLCFVHLRGSTGCAATCNPRRMPGARDFHTSSDAARQVSAKKLQSAARSVLSRRQARRDGPDMEVARGHKDDLLAHDPATDELYDFFGPLTPTFDLFGAGVVAYMRMVDALGRHFWMLSGFALSNLVANFYGGALGPDRNVFNIGTIGNAELTPSHGMMEFVISVYLVRFLYRARGMIEAEERRIDEAQSTPADFALQLDGLPPDAADDDFEMRLRKALGEMEPSLLDAAISHTGVSLANRKYVLAVDALGMAKARLHDLQTTLARTTHGGTVLKLRGAVDAQSRAVDRLKADVARLQTEPSSRQCSGVGFVAFEHSASAKAALRCAALGGVLRLAPKHPSSSSSGGGVETTVSISRPPEPDSVQWENLPCTWWETSLRQLVGTTIVLVTAFAGTALITVAQYLTPTLTKGVSGVGELVLVQVLLPLPPFGCFCPSL